MRAGIIAGAIRARRLRAIASPKLGGPVPTTARRLSHHTIATPAMLSAASASSITPIIRSGPSMHVPFHDGEHR
jgi:hypothetical protein